VRLKTSTLALFLAGLAPVASAHAATAPASPLAGVKVAACQSGDQTSGRKATFVGHMRSVPGGAQLVMRFQLEEQYGGRRFTRVTAPELRGWRKSRAGVQSYSYSQSVTGLVAGESYRAQVQFRWLDSSGNTVLQVRRHSAVCAEPGELPNLRVLDVLARPGIVPGTEAYTVDVVNSGLAPAAHVALQLVVDGATPDITTVDSFEPGEIHAIHFTGPRCVHRVRATVDPSDTVHETVEKDNSMVVPCPPQG
jgi:hypothetical protein